MFPEDFEDSADVETIVVAIILDHIVSYHLVSSMNYLLLISIFKLYVDAEGDCHWTAMGWHLHFEVRCQSRRTRKQPLWKRANSMLLSLAPTRAMEGGTENFKFNGHVDVKLRRLLHQMVWISMRGGRGCENKKGGTRLHFATLRFEDFGNGPRYGMIR